MPEAAGDAGPRRWQEGVEADMRRRVFEKILAKLVQIYQGKLSPSHDLNRIATSFEQKMFNEAKSKEEYIKRIAHKLLVMERSRQPLLQDASGVKQQIQMGCKMQPVNTIQTMHGGNSSVTAMPQVSPTTSSHEGRSPHMRNLPIAPSSLSPVPKHQMTYPVAPNMHIKNGRTNAVTMSDQILKSSPAIVTPSAGVHPSQRMIQPGERRNQNELSAMQMQPINFSSGNTTSVAQSQGQPIQPNGQQNLLRQNARGTTRMLPQQQLRMNQQGSEVNQQKMSRQTSQMVVAPQDNVAKMQAGHPREQNNQQNAELVGSPLQMHKHIKMEPQQLSTVNQQSSLHSASSQTVASMGSVEEVDWREQMFQQMKALKDAYLSELVELDQLSDVPKITKEAFELLPKDQAEQYRFRVYMKKRIRAMLSFLQLQKSNIPEHLRGQLPMFVKAIQNVLGFYRRKKDQSVEMGTGHSQISHKRPQIIDLTGDLAQSSGCTSSQQKQPEHSMAFHLRQNPMGQNTATRTQAVSQENHSNILLGVASSCVPVRSPGSVQSMPSDKFQDYCTLSPVTKESPVKVSSPSASAKSLFSSPVAKQGTVIGASHSMSSPIAKRGLKVTSPSPSAKSTVPSPIVMFGLQATLPCALAGSTSPSPVAKVGIVKVSSPPGSVCTLPSLIEKAGVAQAASPCSPLKSALSPLGANSGVVLVASPPASVSTLPSPIEKVGVPQAASPCSPVKSVLSPSGANSGVLLVASPCASIKSTSSENVETISALLQKNNAAAAASDGSTTNLLMPSSLVRAETTDLQAEDLQHNGAETPAAKKPMERLIDAVRSISSAALKSSTNSICSIVSMDDWVPRGELDTVQHWTFFSKQGVSSPPNKIKRIFEIRASCPQPQQLADMWELEDVEHGVKRQKTQNARNALLDEIESVNNMLMDTITSITDDNRTDGITSGSGGTLIKLSYTAVSLAPDLKSLFATSEMPVIMPTKLLIPADYPRSSPILVNDQRGEQLRNLFNDISESADVAFRDTLNGIPEPRSIMETVRAWDTCVRCAVTEFAQRFGGGMFSSRYGHWESFGDA